MLVLKLYSNWLVKAATQKGESSIFGGRFGTDVMCKGRTSPLGTSCQRFIQILGNEKAYFAQM